MSATICAHHTHTPRLKATSAVWELGTTITPLRAPFWPPKLSHLWHEAVEGQGSRAQGALRRWEQEPMPRGAARSM
jgi:hypothetical protein